MQAIILAGGKGTRLGAISRDIPKPMTPIGGKPIIEHQIDLLKKYGINSIIITVGHQKEKLMNHLRDGHDFGVAIEYFEEEESLGTAGAIPLIVDKLQSQFLLLYGDVMMDLNLKKLLDFHNKKEADVTLVVHPNDHPYDSDLVEIDSSARVSNFISKPHPAGTIYKNLVNAGLYVFNKSATLYIPKGQKSDFGKDIFPQIVKNQKLFAYNTSEYLKDMGTPDRLAAVEEDYKSGKIQRRNHSLPQVAIFMDRDGVLNEDRPLIHKLEDMVLFNSTADAIKQINKSDYLSIVVTNQSVVARNLCTIEELEEIHKKLDTDLGEEGAKLDALYYCPYHPDKGYPEENPDYKKDHPWRKPKPGMLLQAAQDFNIDLQKSYMIGDRCSDIEAGKRAGTKTIGVRSGSTKEIEDCNPDFVFDNLKEATQFILERENQEI